MKIRNFALPIFHQLPKISAFALVFFMLPTFLTASDTLPVPFSDLPTNPLWYPAIEVFQNQNIIIGDTMGGVPTGYLRPSDHLQRAEFTKVATLVRLLEEKQDEGILSNYMNTDLNDFTLKTNSPLQPYYTSRPGAPKFVDVPEKDITCAKDPGGCEPWFTQYVNYMASLGTIQGTGGGRFSPTDSIKRIHALKMIMVDNGKIPAEQDLRFIRISNDERIKNRVPRCLNGAGDYILNNNGGNTQDSQNLLAYALLADKLDIFGNSCQFFEEKNAHTPTARAELLQKPLTRQEVARFFALTTTIPELQLDAGTDPTVDIKSEYITPISKELKEEEDPLEKLKTEGRLDSELNEPRDMTDEDAVKETEPKRLNRPLADMMVSELTAIHKQGRCCSNSTISFCKVIQYDDYLITEEPELGDFTDGTALWHRAERGNEVCFVPYADIVNGYKGESTEAHEGAELVENYTKLLEETDAGSSALLASLDSSFAMKYLIKRRDALFAIKGGTATAEDFRLLGYNEEQIKSLLEIQALTLGIRKNMDADFQKGRNAVNTCKWALKGKSEGSEKYKIVMTWCNAHGVTKEDLKSKKIDREYTATFKEETLNGTKATFPKFTIKIRGNTDSFQADASRPLYILIHGWMGSPDGWINTTADILEGYRPDPQILIVDWKDLAKQGLVPNHVTPLMEGMGKVIAEALDEWGARKEKTTFIGHSLGTIMSSLAAEKMTEGTGYPDLILLDPLASFSENKINYEGLEFHGFNGEGVCLVADDGLLSSETLLSTCGHQFLIEYDDPKKEIRLDELNENFDFTAAEYVEEKLVIKTYKFLKNGASTGKDMVFKVLSSIGMEIIRSANKHLWVADTYQTISWSPFADNLLTLDGVKNGGADLGGLNGIIYTERDERFKIKYLKVILADPDHSDMYTLLGNTRANTFECKEDKVCYMLGGKGGDSFNVNRHHTDSVIEDFRQNLDEDKLMVSDEFRDFEQIIGTANATGRPQNGIQVQVQYGSNLLSKRVKVFFEGVTLDEVEEWVSIATGAGKYKYYSTSDLKEEQKDNPIQIK